MRKQFHWTILVLISTLSAATLRAEDEAPLVTCDAANITDSAGGVYFASAQPEAMPSENCYSPGIMDSCQGACCSGPCCSGSCCSGYCCQDSCCDEPLWTARTGWVYLHRSRPESVPLLRDPAGTTVLNADQFRFGYDSGVDLGLRRKLNCDWDVDMRYYGFNDFSASAGPLAAPVGSTLNTTPASTLLLPAIASMNYRSDIRSAEISLRKECGCFGLMGGFRYVELDEQLDAIFDPTTILPTVARWRTRNRLYGFQLGADAIIWQHCNGFHLDGFAKAGIYGNAAASSLAIGAPVPPPPPPPVVPVIPIVPDEDPLGKQVSFLGELGLIAYYPITDHIHLQAGYQLMWVDGVALASEQVARVSSFNTAPITATIDTHGEVFYHGANVGLEFTW